MLGVCVSGFFLTVELTAVAMQRRGVPVRERLAQFRERKLLALGFGVPLALLFLLPLVAVFAMPGAVAGATLMVRGLHPAGERTEAADDPYAHLPQVSEPGKPTA